MSEEEAFSCDLSLDVKEVSVIERHVMAISSKNDEVLATIDEPCVTVSSCRSLSFDLSVATVLSWCLVFILNRAVSRIILVRRDVLPLFH